MGATQAQMERLIELLGQIRWVLALGLLCFLIGVGLFASLAVALRKLLLQAISAELPAADTAALFRERMQNLLDRGRYDELIATLGETIKEFPEHLDAHYYLAHVYARKREWDLARRHAQEVKRIYPPWSDYVDSLTKYAPKPDQAAPAPTPDAAAR